MRRLIPRIATSCFVTGLVVLTHLTMNASTAIAHQHLTVGDVTAMVHLQPNDSPFAGASSLTWIHLTNANGETISLADCNCNLMIYDSQNQLIAQPELAETAAEGQEQLISTNITFPSAGTYQLVFTAQPKANQFEPFELKLPVTVRPASP